MKYVLMYTCILASQVALVVKNPPVSAGDERDGGSSPGSGRSPGGGHGTHSSTLAWRIPWTEEPGGLQLTGQRESDAVQATLHARLVQVKPRAPATKGAWLGRQVSIRPGDDYTATELQRRATS